MSHQLLGAFAWDSAPRYLLRDRDRGYGEKFSEASHWLGIREVVTAAQSPWQDAYVERLIGSIRRECLDHAIVLSESALRRILKSYFEYYERTRTHLSLGKDSPSADRSSLLRWDRSSRSRKSAVCITGTNASPPEGTQW